MKNYRQERKISLLQTKIERITNERQTNLTEEEPLIRFCPNDKALKNPFDLNPKV